jgi:hypothetical protein
MSYVTSIISSKVSLLFVNYEAACGIAPFTSLPHTASPSVFVNDPLASLEVHVAAACGTKHLSF